MQVYRLSLKMAKELAMIENNEVGALVRKYYIWCDDMALEQIEAANRVAEGARAWDERVRERMQKLSDINAAPVSCRTVYPPDIEALL